VAVVGATVAVSVCVLPTGRLGTDVGATVTPVTDTPLTVTVHVAVLLPSSVVAVMVAVPIFSPFTVQGVSVAVVWFTLAIVESLLLQVTFLLVAVEGATVAVSVCVPPTAMLADVGATVTPVTATVFVTVTAHVAVFLPSTVVAVIVAVPAATPVTVPSLTVAVALLLLVQVTFLLVALEGATVATRVSVPPMEMEAVVLFNVTPVTGTLAPVTVTLQVAVLPPTCVSAVTTAVPVFLACTMPFMSTETMDSSLEYQ